MSTSAKGAQAVVAEIKAAEREAITSQAYVSKKMRF